LTGTEANGLDAATRALVAAIRIARSRGVS
jgi:hypothetical protein